MGVVALQVAAMGALNPSSKLKDLESDISIKFSGNNLVSRIGKGKPDLKGSNMFVRHSFI